MRARQGLAVAAQVCGECIAFGLALLAVFWLFRNASVPTWLSFVSIGVVYLIVGAVPWSSGRRLLFIGIAAFLVTLFVVGWIDWQIEYFLFFEHLGAWENLPRVMLSPANLGGSATLSLCAILGQMLFRYLSARSTTQ